MKPSCDYEAIEPINSAVDKAIAPFGPALVQALQTRSIALVGMMGAGKSSIGRRLAARLAIPFVDADAEIELAADMTIPEFFEKYGEAAFRAGEARVIGRLLDHGPQVLATGGGAFMSVRTREAVARKAISVWLKADFDLLVRRVRRRNDRPMLHTRDPAETLKRLIAERDPIYALADATVLSRDVAHDIIVDEILAAIAARLSVSARQEEPDHCDKSPP